MKKRTAYGKQLFLVFLFLVLANHSQAQQWNTNGNNINNANSGNVGVGTNTPAYKLDVTPNFRLNNDGTGHIFNWYPAINSSGTNYYKALDINGYQLPIASGAIDSGYRIGLGVQGFVSDMNFAGTLAYQFGIWARHGSYTATSTSRINYSYGVYIDSLTNGATQIDHLWGLYQSSPDAKNYFAGNVGIGTDNPGSPLTVYSGQAQSIRMVDSASSSPYIAGYSAVTGGTRYGFLQFTSGGSTISASTGPLQFYAGNEASERMRINSNGNVGIGTTAPNYKLDVAGSGISLIGGGDVGAAVNITNTGKTATGTANYWNIYNMTGGYGNKLSFWAYAATNACAGGLCQDTLDIYDNGLVHVPFNLGVGTTDTGSYKLKVSGNTNVTGNLTITANGTGTGNIVADGTINAKYQDVAEWVPSSEQLSAGTVVVLDSTKSNQVTSSSVSYDTRVAGVVSEQPGIALGEKSVGKVLVATTGRVRVKVDASRGPIHIGDLLVTSDVPGFAMKSEPIKIAGRKIHAPGTLIGKALEPLEKGKGEILVLLSLQ